MNRQRKASSWSDEQVTAALSSAKSKLETLRNKLREPLAVIGLGCRFPQASGPDQFWKLLKDGGCAITETPEDRWDSSLKAGNDKDPGKVTANRGGFLDGVDQFDASFFGIARREAETIDPQQRLLLEVTWETVEHAGLDAGQLRASRTGVFVGICSNDYLHRLTTRDRSSIDAYLGTGNAHGAAAGRLSYFMNWQGPSVAVDTACSSSLTALHLAARSLRYDDCDMALVAGVNVILTPELSVNMSQAGMLSPTGLCQTFDSAADGFVRGEGCGAILLKRLSRAVADGDRILCLVRGSAANQDGRSNGLTAPNGVSQQTVVRAALADANVSPEQIDYLEAHGTGTQLGDPIEMSALGAVFGPGRDRESPLRVGSVKTNIGHLEGAAGVAGIIKVALALHHEEIPAHLHFNTPSSHIDWSLPIEVPTTMTAWQRGDRARMAGVSSFGFGGTNAHIVLEEAPQIESRSHLRSPDADKRLLSISAKTPTALRQIAAAYAQVARSGCSLDVLCHSANVGRAHFDHRLAIVADTIEELGDELEKFATTDDADAFVGSGDGEFGVHWLFGDKVDCYATAGKTLYERHPSFRDELDRCRDALADYWPRGLQEILWGEGPAEASDVLPALFCLQYATAQLWRSWGIAPRVVVGHEFGEYAAACAAGVFSLSDGLRLVTRQAELMRTVDNAREMQVSMAAEAQRTSYAPPHCTYVSTRDGDGTYDDVASADYWVRRLREPIDLSGTLQRVVESTDVHLCLEMGVGRSVSKVDCSDLVLLPGLTSLESEWSAAVQNLAQLYTAGATIDWRKFAGGASRKISLPTYPFERKRYWYSDKIAVDDNQGTEIGTNRVHPLLGVKHDLGGHEVVFETDLKDHPYLCDHRVGSSIVFPAAGFLELAMAAGSQVNSEQLAVTDLMIHRPVSWESTESCRLQVILAPAVNGYDCRIVRREERNWQTAAECRIVQIETPVADGWLVKEMPDLTSVAFAADVQEHYLRCRNVGVDYGQCFQGIRRLVKGDREAWGEIVAPDVLLNCSDYVLHPALLDSCFQVSAAAMQEEFSRAWLPVSVASYQVIRSSGASASLHTYVQIHPSDDDDSITANVQIADCDGLLIAEIRGLLFKPTRRKTDSSAASKSAPKRDMVGQLLRKPANAAHDLLQDYLYGRLSRIMEMEVDEIPVGQPLNSLGLDSLMAFELREDLERDLGVTVPFEIFLQDLSLKEFTAMLLKKLNTANRSADGSLLPAEVSANESWIEGAI